VLGRLIRGALILLLLAVAGAAAALVWMHLTVQSQRGALPLANELMDLSKGSDLPIKVSVIETAIRVNRPSAADPVAALAAVGGFEHAGMVGYLLGAAALRTPVVLDGVIACSAALVARAIAPHAADYWVAGHRSAEPGATAALAHLGLVPLVDFGMRLGEGSGAALAVPLVQAAARVLRDVASFDSAGVTDRE